VVYGGMAALFTYLAFGLGVQSTWTPITFIAGGFFSALLQGDPQRKRGGKWPRSTVKRGRSGSRYRDAA
jgi:hypothetical protein